jgi:hypothetical protein
MLYFAAIWLLLLPLCAIWGTGWLNGLDAIAFRRLGDRLMAAVWLGLISFAVVLMAVSLLWPLTPWVGLLVAAGLTFISLLSSTTRIALRRLWQTHVKRRLGVMLCAVMLVATLMSQRVTWADTGYYHGSAIQWLAQYGTVPGVALIFNNLGFTSSWFALLAPFNPPAVLAQASAIGNGLVAVIGLMHLALVTKRVLHREAERSDWFMVLFLGGAIVASTLVRPFKEILTSASPDLPILFLTGTIAWSMLIASADAGRPGAGIGRSAWVDGRAVPLMLAAGAATIKLTALPALLIAGLFFWLVQRLSLRRLATAIGLVSLIMLPNMVASVITSGCPLYPSAVMCFDLPWAPTAQAAHQIAANTHDWISWYGTPPAGSNPWLWAIGEMMKSKRDQVSLVLIGVTLFSSLYVVKRMLKQRSFAGIQSELWVVSLGVFGIIFLLVTSVFFRFLLPYILVIVAMVGALLGDSLTAKIAPIQRPHLRPLRLRSGYLTLVGLTVAMVTVGLVQQSGANVLLPPSMPQGNVMQKNTNGIVYYAPKSGDLSITMDNQDDAATKAQKAVMSQKLDRCWAAPLPCSYGINSDVHLRDAQRGIAAGFERQGVHGAEERD